MAELSYGFCTANMKKSGVSVSSANTSQKMFIRSNTISEIVCYQSVSLTVCHKKPVQSKFTLSSSSRSEEQELFQPEPGKGGREHAGPFCGITGVCVRLFISYVQFLF
jgi:hypothetical protein